MRAGGSVKVLCYFLAIGAVVDPLRLTRFFEEHLAVDVATAQSTILAAFPSEDVVRILTRGGCSCDLLELHASTHGAVSTGSIGLTLACRHALAAAAVQLGAISVYVRSRKEWRPGRTFRFVMTLDELLRWRAGVPADVLVDVVVKLRHGDLH
jgi:hypothetical protein